MSTTIPATPMPNATGTETQPAPMVEVFWTPNKDYHCQETWPPHTHPLSSLFHNARLQWPANMDSRFQYERLVDWLACLHPAPATLADETLRAENEKLREDRDNWQSRAAERDAECEKRFRAQHDAIERAEAAEAKLAALFQPAPVVEDGTARDRFWKLRARLSRDKVPERRSVSEARKRVFSTLAPEGQNAEAKLVVPAEDERRRQLRLNERRRCVTWLHERAKKMNDPHAAIVLNCAARDLGNSNSLATAPAVPDGRTEEVEKLREAVGDAVSDRGVE